MGMPISQSRMERMTNLSFARSGDINGPQAKRFRYWVTAAVALSALCSLRPSSAARNMMTAA